MHKHLWLIGPLILLVIAACRTTPTPDAIKLELTKMVAVAGACATQQAAGTPQPCINDTPTPLPTFTPTATPFTGWKQLKENGEFVRNMPLGWQPRCNWPNVIGCPGKTYLY